MRGRKQKTPAPIYNLLDKKRMLNVEQWLFVLIKKNIYQRKECAAIVTMKPQGFGEELKKVEDTKRYAIKTLVRK